MREQTKKIIEKNLYSARAGKVIHLSHENLSIADYQWLVEKLKQACFVETLSLPEIKSENAEAILTLLDKATKTNSTLREINIHFSEPEKKLSQKLRALQLKIKTRLARNKKQIFGIHGGGNIGLGLMADIVTKSPQLYNILATSNKKLNNILVNSVNQLWLQHGDSDATSRVTNIELISRESADVIRLYKDSSMAALCITPAVMPMVANDIATALIQRYKHDGSGLKILVLMNLPNNAQFVMEAVSKALHTQTTETEAQQILSVNEFVPTVIDRIVTPIPEDNIQEQLRIQLNAIEKYRLWLHLYTADVEKILEDPVKLARAIKEFNLKFKLFNAEKKFTMYVDDKFYEAKRFSQIDVTHDLNVIEAVKNKYINGPHAILAWMGALYGCETISQSIQHPYIFRFIKDMMENEIAPILTAEYPKLTKEELINLEHTFLERCAASTDDPVTRVGRDPMRKLDQGGRIRGTLEIAQKHSLSLPTLRLEEGMAAGFLYAIKGIDPDNQESQKLREIYKKNGKLFSAVLCYKGKAPSGTSFTGLDREHDHHLIFRLQRMLSNINQWFHYRKHPVSTMPVNGRKENYIKHGIKQPYGFWHAKTAQHPLENQYGKTFGLSK